MVVTDGGERYRFGKMMTPSEGRWSDLGRVEGPRGIGKNQVQATAKTVGYASSDVMVKLLVLI